MEKKEKFEVRMRLFYLRLHLGEQESVKLIDETSLLTGYAEKVVLRQHLGGEL